MKFSIRDLLLVTVIVALVFGWWVDRKSIMNGLSSERLKGFAEEPNADSTLNRYPGYRPLPWPNSQAPVPNPPKD
jgi:hypothetical protein